MIADQLSGDAPQDIEADQIAQINTHYAHAVRNDLYEINVLPGRIHAQHVYQCEGKKRGH